MSQGLTRTSPSSLPSTSRASAYLCNKIDDELRCTQPSQSTVERELSSNNRKGNLKADLKKEEVDLNFEREQLAGYTLNSLCLKKCYANMLICCFIKILRG